MTAMRTFLAVGGAAALLLAIVLPADAQVIGVNRGINPWTGHAYRDVLVRNPWTGRVGAVSTVVDPWTGARARSVQVYDPWTGRSMRTGGVRNPWTGQPRWDVNRRRGWW
jgi:hypothetical protein